MKHVVLLFYLWIISCTSLSANIITNGLAITDAATAMKRAGYIETELAMMPARDEALQFWVVGEGVLIINHSIKSKKVAGLTFWLSDERPRAYAKTFALGVASFDTKSGVMIVQTRKGEPDGAANGSQPIRSK